MCGSPKLIAACHVLLRLSLPRHPPCALSSLTIELTPAQGAESLRSCLFAIPSYSPESNPTTLTRIRATTPKDTLLTLNTLPELSLTHCLCSALYVYAPRKLSPRCAPRGGHADIRFALPNQFRCQTSESLLSPKRSSPEAVETCWIQTCGSWPASRSKPS